MSNALTKPGGWGVNDELASAEITDIDVKTANSVDKSVAGDTISGIIAMSGLGRIRTTTATGADADTTYQPGGGNQILKVPSSITANRTYTLGTTGVGAGDWIDIYCADALTYVVTVLNGATPIAYLSGGAPATSAIVTHQACRFVYDGTNWLPEIGGRNPGDRSTTFTASGSWVVPPNVYAITVQACGGGGGGGGGYTGANRGGAGGSAAPPARTHVRVTPGTTLTVSIGAGGTGGATGAPGATGTTGGDTTLFNGGTQLALAPGGYGGGGGQSGSGGTPAQDPYFGGYGDGGSTVSTIGSIVPGSTGTRGALHPFAPNSGGGGGGAGGLGGSGGGGGGGVTGGGFEGPGASAGANTGAGGGGGGPSFAGGAGGSGVLTIIWS